MNDLPWLSQQEIDDLCQPLTQSAAQIRYLKSLGLTVNKKPSGAPIVIRSHVDQMNLTGIKKKPEKRGPNRAALAQRWSVA